MAIRTAVALSDRRSLQRRAVTAARPAFFIGSEIHGPPGVGWGGRRRMDPAGFVCAGSTRRSNLTGLRVGYYSVPGNSGSVFFFFSAVRSLRGFGQQIVSAVGGQQTGSSVRPVI